MGKPNQTPRRRRAPPSGVELSETLPGGAAQQSAETCHRVKLLRGATLSATSCCDPPAHLGSVKDTLRNVEKRPSADTAVEILLGHYGDGLPPAASLCGHPSRRGRHRRHRDHGPLWCGWS